MVPAGHWGYFKGSCKPPVTQDLDKLTNAEQEKCDGCEYQHLGTEGLVGLG